MLNRNAMHAGDDLTGDDGWEDAAEDADGDEGHEDLKERADEGCAQEHAVRVRAGALCNSAVRCGRRRAGAVAVHGIKNLWKLHQEKRPVIMRSKRGSRVIMSAISGLVSRARSRNNEMQLVPQYMSISSEYLDVILY